MSRSTGRSVVAAAAYRLGEQLHETEVDQTHDYRRRSGVTVTFTCAPADAPAWAHDPERLWNAANTAEKRKNSTLAREVELALPAAVSAEARENIARAMSQELVDRYGVVVSGAIHAPSRRGDQNNFHAHILFTTRRMEPDGLGAKTRVLDAKATGPAEIAYLRAFASDLINAALEEAGSDERVDHRSFAARGIEAEPTQHKGPGGTAKERRKEPSERGGINEEIDTDNRRFDELVQDLATLDAEIAAEEKRLLDARFGAADAEPASSEPDPPPPGPSSGDALKSAAPPAALDLTPDQPEPVRPGLVERAKRTFSGWFGRGTPSEPDPAEPPPRASTAVEPPPPDPASPPESGDRALAAFFRVATATATVAAYASLAEPRPQPEPLSETPTDRVHADLLAKMQSSGEDPPAVRPATPEPASMLEAVHSQTVKDAILDRKALEVEETTTPGSRFERVCAWWGSMRHQFDDWRGHLQERFEQVRGLWPTSQPAPEQSQPPEPEP